MDERSVFAAPLPFDCTLEGLTEFFKKVGPVRCVRMRRSTATKDFRGSVFVEFDSKELAEEVRARPLSLPAVPSRPECSWTTISLSSWELLSVVQVLKQKLVYEGAPLRLESKNSYMARKIAERKSKVDLPFSCFSCRGLQGLHSLLACALISTQRAKQVVSAECDLHVPLCRQRRVQQAMTNRQRLQTTGKVGQLAGRPTGRMMTHMVARLMVSGSVRGSIGPATWQLGCLTGQLLALLLPPVRGSPQNHHMRKAGCRHCSWF